ncbi:hypothetical protein [Ruegeria arenilitoris]|uniref:hypothetical protein n=1 Tax=Ruegeria arenilitoris TaxID=1173585 RepID=UPI00147DC7EA|nr:hypothetical protein [Ruegeria arenilitoris]
MTTLTVKTAPTRARKLVKASGFIRATLNKCSHVEQDGTQGATRERETVTAEFARDIAACERAIADTEATADAFDRAALVLRSGHVTLERTGPVGLACKLVRWGASDETRQALAEKLSHAAQRARQSAEKAQDRLEDNNADLAATASLGAYLAELKTAGFRKTTKTERLRKSYNAWRTAAGKVKQ